MDIKLIIDDDELEDGIIEAAGELASRALDLIDEHAEEVALLVFGDRYESVEVDGKVEIEERISTMAADRVLMALA